MVETKHKCDLSPLRNLEKYGRPMKLAMANSEHLDEMPHNAAFHQGLHC